jgi:enoyl-CoA hydratase
MTESGLIVSADSEVGRIRLNFPEQGNRLSQDSVSELGKHLRALSTDKSLKAVVISAEGDNFCLGRAPGQRSGFANPLALRVGLTVPILEVYRAVRAIDVPVVALVQGEAHGFGAALAGSADITIAADNARFSFSEMKTDLPPTLAMSTVMDRVAPKALSWLVYTANIIGAAQAQQIGLVSSVVFAGDLIRAGEETIAQLVARKRDALCTVKKFLANTRLMEFELAADYGANLMAVVLPSQ